MNTVIFRRSGARTTFVFSLALLLVACGGQPEQSVATGTPAPVIQASPTAAAPPPAPEPAPEPAPVAVKKPAPVVAEKPAPQEARPPADTSVARVEPATPAEKPAPEPVAPPPPPPPTTDDFLGLAPVGVSALLGEPGLVRREKPAEVWQYAADDCVLHVFLYEEGSGPDLRVDHLEATDLQGAQASTDLCLELLVDR